jgi:hypothetical protein
MFEKEEKKAIEFMESKISEIYKEDFNLEFIGTWHEFGKIYGFKFYIIENNDYPIAVEYNLGNQNPFEFDKEAFEKEYESIKIKIKVSEELEKKITTYYPNARVVSNRIENSDGTYRWVNSIYTAIPLDNTKEKTFSEIDSLCTFILQEVKEQKVFYNFYFPKEIDSKPYTDNRFTFFEFENFSKKHIYHYRVDFVKNEEVFEISNRKLYDSLTDEQSENLIESIEKWKKKNGFSDWIISLLTESSLDRKIEQKKFMLKSSSGNKKFGFINKETNEIIFE